MMKHCKCLFSHQSVICVYCQIYNSTNLTIFLSIFGDIPRIQQSVKREPYKSSTRFTLPTITTPHLYTFYFSHHLSPGADISSIHDFCIFQLLKRRNFQWFQPKHTDDEMKYLCGISNKTQSLTNFVKKFAQSLRRVEHLCNVNKTLSLQTFRESLRHAREMLISPERCWIFD
jgi:hypothetical protein